jgi:general secretion pathway protein B
MSYILDALRKSDQQRQRGAAPTLLAGQATAVAPKRPAFLAYGLLAAVLVGAGMVIGWLRPWQPEQVAPGRAESVAAKPLESTPRQPAPAPSEMAPQPKPEPKLQNATRPAQAAPAPSEMAPQPKPEPKLQNATRPAQAALAPSEMAPQPKPEPKLQNATLPAPALVPTKPQLPARANPETDGTPREADAAAPRRAAAPAPERPADTAAADTARVQTVISMAELPLSVQQELPAMTISVHAYSDNPGARLVGINNRILREGEYVVPGLKLEQITPDGMIFGYKGYSFRRGVK